MTTLTFRTTTLSVINQQNQIFFTTLDIAKALGYSNGDIGVKNLYNRHADEFTPNMTALIEMQTNGGMQKVRIFSLRGCHLIGMLSHTKVAKNFRRWVLDILDRETQQPQQQNLPLAEVDADEEAIRIIANLYHSLRGAFEMGEKIRKQHPYFAKEIDKTIGGHYLYNLNHPTEQALEKAKRYVHAKSERIMFIKGMLSLLDEQPQPKRLTNF
ncbi:Bro-N domain-containing protein [Avibacterium sp. 20-15]|uniref:BRO-N domain-containing protein n=1 Tax=unclassified Avibacterium TaxID=2685287 RepID=UPI002026FC45|nr:MULTISPECIES: Bro-N domain-containing protein [unclassified Avibacterium]MCW9731952.1 Bro-N domain-containing protein [Avibacterium sp. 20-15]URL04141.1 Bro-N domain-containing protein [Avibacterium sp. 20-132]